MNGTNVVRGFWRRVGGWSPLQWLLLTPVVTLPLSALLVLTVGGDLGGASLGLVEMEWTKENRQLDRTHYFYYDFWLTWALLTAPGVLNLLVARWLFHELTYVRLAAGIGLVLAVLRTFIVPVASMVWISADILNHDTGLLIRVPVGEAGRQIDPSPLEATLTLLVTAWTAGLGMWILTFAIWQAYEPLMARFFPRLAPPRERSEGEPKGWSGFLGKGRSRGGSPE